ncbi:MAG: response regulator [Gallionella sp.]|nr:response regulator [Gallionella sp.]
MEQTKQATILVVDDDEFNLKLLNKMLEVEGHAVRTAASGEEALVSVAEQLPDLVLLDVMMPGMDGFEVARRLKADARTRPVPIIMVTALEDQESRLKGLEAGANEFLSKPVNRTELQMRVKNLLKVKDYQDFLADHNRILEEQVGERTAALNHANRALAALSAVNRTLVHATDENELLHSICQAIVEQRGYRLAWVGYVQHDAGKSIKLMASAGHDEGYLDALQLTWAEEERGMGPSGCAVRSGTPQLCQDMTRDPNFAPWRDAALKRGYTASIALPLTNENNAVFGILNVYAGEVNAFSPAEVDLLEEMAGDLAFGVHTLHTRHERDLALVKNQEQLAQLQDSLEDTVKAIATIVEMRDPYTAGHQVRVADLAAAIAKQIGLPDEQINAIHLAGIVHDVGKIQIPAEILSKPGKINDIEFSLIKAHAQSGYDILKDIDFPWPIAQMILQHHERLDGSGYPQGLKGDAILLEARILSVADVVEAMSSHRPYRPGLGIEAALSEITRQRGVYFDPQVVDACVTLFREQHYSFK